MPQIVMIKCVKLIEGQSLISCFIFRLTYIARKSDSWIYRPDNHITNRIGSTNMKKGTLQILGF